MKRERSPEYSHLREPKKKMIHLMCSICWEIGVAPYTNIYKYLDKSYSEEEARKILSIEGCIAKNIADKHYSELIPLNF